MYVDGPFTVVAGEDIPEANLRAKFNASFEGVLSGAADAALDIGTFRNKASAGEEVTIIPKNKEGTHEFVASGAITGTTLGAAAGGKVATGNDVAHLRRSPAGTADGAIIEGMYL